MGAFNVSLKLFNVSMNAFNSSLNHSFHRDTKLDHTERKNKLQIILSSIKKLSSLISYCKNWLYKFMNKVSPNWY